MSGFEQYITPEIARLLYDTQSELESLDEQSIKIIFTNILTRLKNPEILTVDDIPMIERDIATSFCLKCVKKKDFHLSRIPHLDSPNLSSLRSLAPYVTENSDRFTTEILKAMATTQHNVIACFQYGAKLMSQGSVTEGLSYIEKSAQQKFWRAQLSLGQYYYTKRPTSSNDLEKAIFMLNLAHDNPYKPDPTIGLLDLGIIHYNRAESNDSEEDFKKAFDYFTEVNEKGDFKEVKLFLSICYYFGQGTRQNQIRAINILTEWLDHVRQEDLLNESPYRTPVGFVISGYAQLAAYLARPGMPYTNLSKALEYAKYLNNPSRRQQLPIKLLTIEIIYEKLIGPYLADYVDIKKPETVRLFKFALQMFRPIYETQTLAYLPAEKKQEMLFLINILYELSENEIIYYYPKYVEMLHNLMSKISSSLFDLIRKYKENSATEAEVLASYEENFFPKPKKKIQKLKKKTVAPENTEIKRVTPEPVPQEPKPMVPEPVKNPLPQIIKKPKMIKDQAPVPNLDEMLKQLKQGLKEEEARIEKFYLDKASSQQRKIYHDIMTKGKVTKENLQTFVQFLKNTKEATSRQMSKSGGIERVTLGNYTIGAHAPHNGETHLDKGALADIKNTLIAFYKDQQET